MNDCIVINGKTIELTEKQVEEIRRSLNLCTRLTDIKEGDTFILDGIEFVVLEHSKETTAVITKELIFDNVPFGKNNNFADDDCQVMKKLFDFQKKIEKVIGAGNLISHSVDLTSEDGLKDYGKIRVNMSPLTCDLYRRYVQILDKHKPKKWWWLATPHSTKAHGCDDYVKCVAPSGIINFSYYYDVRIGVRPFCIFNSNIFVSK